MSIRDLVLISIGEVVLAATFALGILVGVSMTTRKDASNGNGNGNQGSEGGKAWDWHRVERR